VLPPAQLELLHQLVLDVQHRFTVYERWGMHRGRRRGLGTTALFSGPSGTGKTLAAEVIANELGLDLYRIDLAAVVSKYIGETEKNLRQVFDEADRGGIVLLFDEADALFGKRTEVSDSHDRYANTEIAYLLQRMEEHRGLAILTTNLRDALDRAFLRRLRFVVEFPFPLADQRAAIWRQAFPVTTPTGDLDVARLAELNLSGGSIHNVATAAAFLAAGDGGPVDMHHVIDATRVECAKLDLPLGLSLNGTRR
jgi:SpoVK/Ycf46/Vps4 family AAA+-type ATPase